MQNNFSTRHGTKLSLDVILKVGCLIAWFGFQWLRYVSVLVFCCFIVFLVVVVMSRLPLLEASWGASQSKRPASIASVATSTR